MKVRVWSPEQGELQFAEARVFPQMPVCAIANPGVTFRPPNHKNKHQKAKIKCMCNAFRVDWAHRWCLVTQFRSLQVIKIVT